MHFVLRHYQTLAIWLAQIYSSAIIFSPQASMVKRNNLDKTPEWLRRLSRAAETEWASLLQMFTGHSALVTAVAFSPDGKRIASESLDDTIKLWEASTGELQMTLVGYSAWVTAVAFSPDGKSIASGSRDQNIKLWGVHRSLRASRWLGVTVARYLKSCTW